MGNAAERIVGRIMLIFIIFLVTAAAYQGYFAKWAFLDSGNGNSFAAIVEGTAYRPFVYRRLLPETATAVENSLAVDQKDWLTSTLVGYNFLAATYERATAAQADYIVRYYLIYGMSFICFFIGILILRQVCMAETQDAAAATLAPLIFALVFPLLETVGGYFYDFSELLFLAAAALLAWRGWWIWLLLLVPLAEFNKESFFFFLITLYPLLRRTKSRQSAACILAGALLTAGLVYIKVRNIYAGNPGGMVEWHFYEQIQFFLQPASFWEVEYNYGVMTGRGFFILHILFIAAIIKKAWPKLSGVWRTHTKLVLTVNLPLFLLFCAPGELRNLSMTYIALVVMLAVFLSQVIENSKTVGPNKDRAQ